MIGLSLELADADGSGDIQNEVTRPPGAPHFRTDRYRYSSSAMGTHPQPSTGCGGKVIMSPLGKVEMSP